MTKYEIVFVHLGNSLPKYLELNIIRTHELFPEPEITLISDAIHFENNFITRHKYVRSGTTDSILVQSKHDAKFREGFWIKSLERLIAVLEYQIVQKRRNVIHIESDVLLMPNAPLEEVARLESPTWTKYSRTKSVGAIFFVPTPESAQKILFAIWGLIREQPDITDMTILNILAEELKLGTTFSHSALEESPVSEESSEGCVDLNRGIFDPAQIGMWLTGEDPRNHLGMNVIHLNDLYTSGDSSINPEKLRFSLDSENRLWATNTAGRRFPIWSLHIHSKNVELFRDNQGIQLKKFVDASSNTTIQRQINIKNLLFLILSNTKNRTLLSYTRSAWKYLKTYLKNQDTN
jgi:hypothetical protein